MSSTVFTSQQAGTARLTLPRVVHAEWIKFRSLRSSWITLAVAAVLTIGFGALFCWAVVSHWDRLPAREHADFTPAEHSLRSYFFAQMALGVLGVLSVTGEYSTGMIRASLSAVPKRLPVLWAKTLVFGAVAWVVATASALVAFFLGQAILSGKHIETTIGAPGVLRVVLGTGLYLTAIGLLAVALGTLIRNTAGGIAAVFGLLLVLPLVSEALPSDWQSHVVPYLPSNAGAALMHISRGPNEMAPWAGFGLLCGYVVVAMAGAALVLRRRDA
ncbi:ABC transporter permease [Kitasatospora sp. NPDC058965]|uniref:ABC transporter permease n=1 Tax=Kitasatospora sp. NPDC058965 TaxID=3346682 RepID=UPI0036CD099B